jgi:hypothetical protein
MVIEKKGKSRKLGSLGKTPSAKQALAADENLRGPPNWVRTENCHQVNGAGVDGY